MSNKNKNLTETLSFTHIYSLKRFSECMKKTISEHTENLTAKLAGRYFDGPLPNIFFVSIGNPILL